MKFLLVIKICSALHGDCLPEQNVNTYDSWYNCAKSGVYETSRTYGINRRRFNK